MTIRLTPTPVTHDPSAGLIARLGGDDPEAALPAGLARLAAGGDLPLLGALVKAMVGLGVAGLARRVVRAAGAAAVVEDLDRRLAALPTGEMPREALRRRFDDNVAALLRTRPHLEEHVSPADRLDDDLHVFATPAGNAHVIRDDPRDRLAFVFPFVDQMRQAAAIALDEDETSAYMLCGVPSPPLLRRLVAIHGSSGRRPPIEIVEHDVPTLILWLHLIEDASWLDGAQVGVFAGPDALEQYRRSRVERLWRQDPTRVMTCGRPSSSPPVFDAERRAEVRRAVLERQHELLDRQAALYETRTARDWAERYAAEARGGPALRVVGLTTRFSTVLQHAMRDLAAAFERRGCRFEIVKEPDDSAGIVDTWSVLAREAFDLVVVLNHARHEVADRVHENLPYVCWIQDHMPALCTREAGRAVGPLDLVLCHAPWLMETWHGYPPDRMLATSNLTDAATYDDDEITDADLERLRCDLSYVGHGAGTADALIDEMAETNEPIAARLRAFAALARPVLEGRGFLFGLDVYRLMLRAERESGMPPLTPEHRGRVLQPLAMRLYDRMLRHQTLEWAAEWARRRGAELRLYGRGWADHPTLGAFAVGEVANGRELRCVCRASAVNLQVNGYGTLHQRLLDCIASGGFPVCRFNPTDLLRAAHVAVAEAIRFRDVRTFGELFVAAGADRELHGHLRRLADLGMPCVDPDDPGKRREELTLVREAGVLPEAETSEAALFDALVTMRYVAPRTAADLPGLDETTFHSCASMHGLLDRFVGSAPERARITGGMRDAVVSHDTYDQLVERLVLALERRLCERASKPEPACAAVP